MNSIKKHEHYTEKENWRKKSIPRTEYGQRSGEQIDGSILKEFFLACSTRTLDWDLCLI